MPLRPSQVETLRLIGQANERGEAMPPWTLAETVGILSRAAQNRLVGLEERDLVWLDWKDDESASYYAGYRLTQLGREALEGKQ